jgi:hypothetical protein
MDKEGPWFLLHIDHQGRLQTGYLVTDFGERGIELVDFVFNTGEFALNRLCLCTQPAGFLQMPLVRRQLFMKISGLLFKFPELPVECKQFCFSDFELFAVFVGAVILLILIDLVEDFAKTGLWACTFPEIPFEGGPVF